MGRKGSCELSRVLKLGEPKSDTAINYKEGLCVVRARSCASKVGEGWNFATCAVKAKT